MAKFRDLISLRKLAAVHASIQNHFTHDRHLNRRDIFEQNRSAALAVAPRALSGCATTSRVVKKRHNSLNSQGCSGTEPETLPVSHTGRDRLAVDAVLGEPVSVVSSLFGRGRTGNSGESQHIWAIGLTLSH